MNLFLNYGCNIFVLTITGLCKKNWGSSFLLFIVWHFRKKRKEKKLRWINTKNNSDWLLYIYVNSVCSWNCPTTLWTQLVHHFIDWAHALFTAPNKWRWIWSSLIQRISLLLVQTECTSGIDRNWPSNPRESVWFESSRIFLLKSHLI